MKDIDIAIRYNLPSTDDFRNFLRTYKFDFTQTVLGTLIIDDNLVEDYVRAYRTNLQYRQRQAEENSRAAQEKAQALSEMLITSGYSFEGYRIIKYAGYISGDDAVQIPRSGVFGGNNGGNLTGSMSKIRRIALEELKEAAYNLGCNAVIGVDFDYITLHPETANITGGTLYEPYIICVTANGTAVVIEKEIK